MPRNRFKARSRSRTNWGNKSSTPRKTSKHLNLNWKPISLKKLNNLTNRMKNNFHKSTKWKIQMLSLTTMLKNPNPNQTPRKKTWWGSWTWSEHSNKISINRKKLISKTNNNNYWRKTNNPKMNYNINNRFRNWTNQKPAMMSKLISRKKLSRRKTRNWRFGKRR